MEKSTFLKSITHFNLLVSKYLKFGKMIWSVHMKFLMTAGLISSFLIRWSMSLWILLIASQNIFRTTNNFRKSNFNNFYLPKLMLIMPSSFDFGKSILHFSSFEKLLFDNLFVHILSKIFYNKKHIYLEKFIQKKEHKYINIY